MAFHYELIHHPEAARDYRKAVEYFAGLDPGLAAIFQEDFRAVLQEMASGRAVSHLYAAGHAVRWVKLPRFSHKIFFEPEGDHGLLVLAVLSGRRHPALIEEYLSERRSH